MVDMVGTIPTVIPDVLDRLLQLTGELFTETDGVTVADAIDTSGSTGDQLVIGAGDPDVDGYADAADSTGEWATTGLAAEREESGAITCVAIASGDGDMASVRRRAYAIVAQVAAMCHANYTLKADVDDPVSPGVDGLEWVRFGATTQLIQGIDVDGSLTAMVLFRIQFQARI